MVINLYPKDPIVLIDDEEDILIELSKSLRQIGINNIIKLTDSRMVMDVLETNKVSIIILDLMMPYVSGEEILENLSDLYPDMPTIVLTASNKIETAIKCMKLGARDFILKPVERDEFLSRVKKVLDIFELQEENRNLTSHMLSDELLHPEVFENIITQNRKMKSIFKYLEAISKSNFPVLIAGESGVGKELIAQAIHKLSCKEKDMVSINVAGIDDTFFSDTLFGHVKGAYTGASENRNGLIEKAQDSTLFLDEIGDLESNSQKKLLRLLQEHEYYKLGSDSPKNSRARVITATCVDLEEKIKKKEFRQDLFFRLKTHYIYIPPLRERKEDIPGLVTYIIKEVIKRPEIDISKEVFNLLAMYDYPGNIRELQSILINLCALCPDGVMTKEIVCEYFYTNNFNITEDFSSNSNYNLDFNRENIPTLYELEVLAINKVMELSGQCQSIAAPILGITQSALSKKLKKINS